jgi:hypothetical protein
VGTGAGTGAGTGVTAGGEPATGHWLVVGLRVERLDRLPPVLAYLDLPFVVERPDELRDLVVAFAERFATRARGT